MTPRVSVIVLNYRSPQDTVECVHALRQQTIADQIDILVVDNHSEDDSIGVIRNRLGSLPGVRVLESATNGGVAHGYNLGERFAEGDYLVVMNPDNQFEADALERMVAKMTQDSSIGILAPKLMFRDGTLRDSVRSFPSVFDIVVKRTWLRRLFPHRLNRYILSEENPDEEREVDWAVGTCLFFRRDFYEDMHGFDDHFFLFFEDTDLCRRCWQAGKRVVYFPAAVAWDQPHRLSDVSFWRLITTKTGRAHVMSACKYFWKWRKFA